ncbi:Uncharacterised protein [Escherichia coli]|uniref:Uncharacterized protein n=1 Tax=Escherichia coli TaxID=562 RepID=A0AAX2K8V6_ECOLX|nr:Uncharacterised protein [Escherichia coli]
MFDEYGRRLSARQKLTHETLIFFGNFARQNGVIKDQLNIGISGYHRLLAPQHAPAGTVYSLSQ